MSACACAQSSCKLLQVKVYLGLHKVDLSRGPVASFSSGEGYTSRSLLTACAPACSSLLQAQAVPESGLGTKQSPWSFGASLLLQEPFSDAHVDIRHRTGEATRQQGRKVRSLYWISMRVKALFNIGVREATPPAPVPKGRKVRAQQRAMVPRFMCPLYSSTSTSFFHLLLGALSPWNVPRPQARATLLTNEG